MATALVPLISSAVAALLPQIPNIVQAVEGLFGPGTGDAKLQTAVAMTDAAAKQLSTAGKIDGIPDATTLTTLIETVVQQLNADGKLGKPAQPASPAPAKPAQAIPTIGASGTIINITGTLAVQQ